MVCSVPRLWQAALEADDEQSRDAPCGREAADAVARDEMVRLSGEARNEKRHGAFGAADGDNVQEIRRIIGLLQQRDQCRGLES